MIPVEVILPEAQHMVILNGVDVDVGRDLDCAQ